MVRQETYIAKHAHHETPGGTADLCFPKPFKVVFVFVWGNDELSIHAHGLAGYL